jgi:hypothetical protein
MDLLSADLASSAGLGFASLPEPLELTRSCACGTHPGQEHLLRVAVLLSVHKPPSAEGLGLLLHHQVTDQRE